MKKRIVAAIIIFTAIVNPVFALTDSAILTDPVANTYEGNKEAAGLIKAASFSDVPSSHWAKEAITRMAAFGVIKGDGANGRYRPDGAVTKEEAIALLIRLMGMEQEALEAGVTLIDTYKLGAKANELWSLGYLQVASNLGFISNDDMSDALTYEQSRLNAEISFMRQYPATREEVAEWAARAIMSCDPGFTLSTEYTAVKNFDDWSQIDIEKMQYVESLLRNNIMNGVSTSHFNPKGSITRAQMAQLMKNADTIYLSVRDMVKKNGTIAAVVDDNSLTTGIGSAVRNLYIRTADGNKDVIKLPVTATTTGTSVLDAVVFNNGSATGLSALREGDELEYIINNSVETENGHTLLVYVHKRLGLTTSTASGRLYDVNPNNNTISFEDPNGNKTTYVLAAGLLRQEDGIVKLALNNRDPQDITKLASGSRYEISITNNIVTEVRYIGEETLSNEIGGVVLENNPDLGYITIFASNRTVMSKQYYESDIFVKKVEFYDGSDQIGYIAQMFPNFKYNPAVTTIDKVEAGDIVFLLLDPADENVVTGISASTNYVARYGKVVSIERGDMVNSLLLESENKQTSWYDIPSEIPVTKEGKIIQPANMQAGDWVRVLVNQAIIEPGHYIESVKEVVVEGDARYITTIAKGKLGSMDEVQKVASITDYEELSYNGWSNYKDVERLDMSGSDTEIYMDGKRITMEYAFRYLKRGGAEAYIALENNYGSQRIKKITFRTGRDDVLSPDTIVHTSGDGDFLLSTSTGSISSDEGTIVVRYGRLVNSSSIMMPDYANVVLNGGNKAAIVSVAEGAGASAPLIVRGRIQSVDQGKSFTVSSIASLSGADWSPTPIQRVFTIDYNTKFYDTAGFRNIEELIDYGEDSARNKSYTILTDGSRAEWIFDMPYTIRAIRGTVAQNNGAVVLKDLTVYNRDTGAWRQQNPSVTALVSTTDNCAVIKSNQVVDISNVEVGQQLMVMTDTLPTTLAGQVLVTGYLTFVEK